MKVYIVAGEPSGDLLASGLIDALVRSDPSVELRGVGGEAMSASGMVSRFDIAEISVMGVFEVLPRLPLILKRIRQTREDIEKWNPDVLVTVDSWGFVSSLLGQLKRRGSKIPAVHYVAPQVWAWKRGRARNVARLVDRLMTLLPDEGRYFEPYGLRCDFVGHPVTERMNGLRLDGDEFRRRHDIPAQATVISILPGSRGSETGRLMPVFIDAAERLRKRHGEFYAVVPTVAGVERKVRKGFEKANFPVRIVTGSHERYEAFNVSSAAIAASGTVSLELAALGVPHVIAYTFNPMTNLLVKNVIRIRFANLINLLSDREIIPEFVLGNCRADLIADRVSGFLSDPATGASQAAEAREVMSLLQLPGILPSDRAAQVVTEAAEGR